MISLKFQKPHRSITSFSDIELPDFTVVTGVNGSGKTHFLEAKKNRAIQADELELDEHSIRLFSWDNLVPPKSVPADPIHQVQERRKFLRSSLDAFTKAFGNFTRNLAATRSPAVVLHDAYHLLELQEPNLSQELRQRGVAEPYLGLVKQRLRRLLVSSKRAAGDNDLLFRAILEQGRSLGKPIHELSLHEIDQVVPLHLNPTDMFQQSFSQIFSAYNRAWHDNQYNDYCNKYHGESNKVFSKEEFLRRYGEPPWDFVNQVLAEAHLDYTINKPDGRAELPFEAKLKNGTTGAEIPFGDLSSGEKVIMSFASCIYNTADKSRHVRHPKLLLFDEIDAPLHPSMTKDLVRVIDEILVRKSKIKVILTTHSPSSVAFAPADALFRMDGHPRKLTRCSRDQAIQILTSGYISITDSTRFVLTEAKYDRLIYSAVAKKLAVRGESPPLAMFTRWR